MKVFLLRFQVTVLQFKNNFQTLQVTNNLHILPPLTLPFVADIVKMPEVSAVVFPCFSCDAQ